MQHIHHYLQLYYNDNIANEKAPVLEVAPTRKEFNGDISIMIFPWVKAAKLSPDVLCNKVGEYLQNNIEQIESFEVVKGYINITLTNAYWIEEFKKITSQKICILPKRNEKIMVEYCGPNTNKPLHLGHLRNVVLGWSMIQLLQAAGYEVVKVNIINDRGVHICKSMYAWMHSSDKLTPETSGIKGDHLVGNYYVRFNNLLNDEYQTLREKGIQETELNKHSKLLADVQQMLVDWENNDTEIRRVWSMMNGWVYDGFNTTYENIGISFDKIYYESETYLLGKKYVEEGLQNGVFYAKDDASIWIDLSAENMDQKLVLRADGTSVYITQDIGTAMQRFQDYKPLQKIIYTVGNEQEYHFSVLQHILNKISKSNPLPIHHLSYGMVNLPEGKMKSREGTVVDADNIIQEMVDAAKQFNEESERQFNTTDIDKDALYKTIGLGALKYFLLKVSAKKNIIFNPKESIDLHGTTGPFIQYVHARIYSLLKRNQYNDNNTFSVFILHKEEKELIFLLSQQYTEIEKSCQQYDPSIWAAYLYTLAKQFNRFYQELPILHADNDTKQFRLVLSELCMQTLNKGLSMLGIEAPQSM